MDPQKLPDASRKPQNDDINKPPTNGETEDISMSNENAQPGTVVVGQTSGATPPTPTSAPTETSPPAPVVQDDMPPFMKDSTSTDVPPATVVGKKKMGMIAIIIAAVLVLAGAALAYYFAYVVPNRPNNVLKSALVSSFSKDKINSVAFDGNALVTQSGSDDKFSMDFSGAGSGEGQLTFTANIDVLVSKVTLDLRSVDGKTFYAKVGGLAGLPELLAQSGNESAALYAPLLSTVNDQWYEINQSLIQQLTGSALETPTLSDADRQKLVKAYEDNTFLTVRETLASEKINGTDSYHYKVAVDGPKLQAFIAAVQAAKVEGLGITAEMFTSLKDGVNGVNFDQYPVDVWIAKDSKLFTQFGFTTENNGATVTLRFTFKDYNKAVTVEKPEGAKPILEVINSFYQSLLGAGMPSDDASGISL